MMGDKPRGEEIQADLDDAERRIKLEILKFIGKDRVSHSIPLGMNERVYNFYKAQDELRAELRKELYPNTYFCNPDEGPELWP